MSCADPANLHHISTVNRLSHSLTAIRLSLLELQTAPCYGTVPLKHLQLKLPLTMVRSRVPNREVRASLWVPPLPLKFAS